MADNDVIGPSANSPWCANVVLVPKSSGGIRYCVNYTALNKVTEDLTYDIPRVDDVLDSVGGNFWFSSLDLARGYWSVPMKASDKPLTAFCSPEGTFEFNVAPFGLKNMPAFFSRMMDQILGPKPACRGRCKAAPGGGALHTCACQRRALGKFILRHP